MDLVPHATAFECTIATKYPLALYKEPSIVWFQPAHLTLNMSHLSLKLQVSQAKINVRGSQNPLALVSNQVVFEFLLCKN